MHIFFLQIRDFRMATKADADRVCLGQSGLRARVWAMAIETFASLRSQMRRFRGLDPLDLLSMARHAKRLPARGQRTKTNNRTVRGNVRKTMTSGRRKLEKT